MIYFARNLCTYGSKRDIANLQALKDYFKPEKNEVTSLIIKPEEQFKTAEEFWDKVEAVLLRCTSFVLFPMVSNELQTIGFASFIELGLVKDKIPVYVYDYKSGKFSDKYLVRDLTVKEYEELKITNDRRFLNINPADPSSYTSFSHNVKLMDVRNFEGLAAPVSEEVTNKFNPGNNSWWVAPIPWRYYKSLTAII